MTVVLRVLRLRAKARYFASFSHEEMDALLSILDCARVHMERTGHELLDDLDQLEPKLYNAFKNGDR